MRAIANKCFAYESEDEIDHSNEHPFSSNTERERRVLTIGNNHFVFTCFLMKYTAMDSYDVTVQWLCNLGNQETRIRLEYPSLSSSSIFFIMKLAITLVLCISLKWSITPSCCISQYHLFGGDRLCSHHKEDSIVCQRRVVYNHRRDNHSLFLTLIVK